MIILVSVNFYLKTNFVVIHYSIICVCLYSVHLLTTSLKCVCLVCRNKKKILIIFLILAKHYKHRVRENELNIHLIAEEHSERYLDQEDQYRREMGLSLESTD